MKAGPKVWKWREGPVGRTEDHFELRYGTIEHPGWNEWLPVALVGRPTEGVFNVQFLVDRTDRVYSEITRQVIKELNFYLVEKGEPKPLKYLQYHCGTGANAYSLVHWSFFPQERAQALKPTCAREGSGREAIMPDQEQRRYPERKERELSDKEKTNIRQCIERGEGDIYKLADQFGCSSSQVAGIKAAMSR